MDNFLKRSIISKFLLHVPIHTVHLPLQLYILYSLKKLFDDIRLMSSIDDTFEDELCNGELLNAQAQRPEVRFEGHSLKV